MMLKRRQFIRDLSILTTSTPLAYALGNSFVPQIGTDSSENELDIHVFSKHLQFLDYETTGSMAAELGFQGVDLTVRPKGHVLPESVSTDLPKAVKAIEKGGSSCKMITTSIESTNNPLDTDIIKSAGQSGIEYYRTHWFKYSENETMIETLARLKEEVKALGELNKANNIIGCYQNHAGTNVGASF